MKNRWTLEDLIARQKSSHPQVTTAAAARYYTDMEAAQLCNKSQLSCGIAYPALDTVCSCQDRLACSLSY